VKGETVSLEGPRMHLLSRRRKIKARFKKKDFAPPSRKREIQRRKEDGSRASEIAKSVRRPSGELSGAKTSQRRDGKGGSTGEKNVYIGGGLSYRTGIERIGGPDPGEKPRRIDHLKGEKKSSTSLGGSQ